MALIEYRIVVDESGNIEVIQDVQEIGPDDRIRFVSNEDNMAVRFAPNESPFANGNGEPIRADLLAAAKTVHAVVNPNSGAPRRIFIPLNEPRRAFFFQCGRMENGEFIAWGPGGTSPGGGSTGG